MLKISSAILATLILVAIYIFSTSAPANAAYMGVTVVTAGKEYKVQDHRDHTYISTACDMVAKKSTKTKVRIECVMDNTGPFEDEDQKKLFTSTKSYFFAVHKLNKDGSLGKKPSETGFQEELTK